MFIILSLPPFVISNYVAVSVTWLPCRFVSSDSVWISRTQQADDFSSYHRCAALNFILAKSYFLLSLHFLKICIHL